MTADWSLRHRDETAQAVLTLGFVIALLPAIVATAAVGLVGIHAIDWWTGYGQWLIGDGVHLSLALKACILAALASAAGLGVTLWAGPARHYARAMINVTVTAVSVWALMQLR